MALRWSVALLFLQLTACGVRPVAEQTVPWRNEPAEVPPATPGPVIPPPPSATDEERPGRAPPVDIQPDLFVAPSLSAQPGLPPPKILPVQAVPPREPNFSPGLPAGPVTNYGTGGLQALPGAPPNPPYPPGGLMH